ncbi:MAG: hypothetical protein R2711_03565 [Acidimicrobiales bacterium]
MVAGTATDESFATVPNSASPHPVGEREVRARPPARAELGDSLAARQAGVDHDGEHEAHRPEGEDRSPAAEAGLGPTAEDRRHRPEATIGEVPAEAGEVGLRAGGRRGVEGEGDDQGAGGQGEEHLDATDAHVAQGADDQHSRHGGDDAHVGAEQGEPSRMTTKARRRDHRAVERRPHRSWARTAKATAATTENRAKARLPRP